jgi:hypothetical protein
MAALAPGRVRSAAESAAAIVARFRSGRSGLELYQGKDFVKILRSGEDHDIARAFARAAAARVQIADAGKPDGVERLGSSLS